MSLFARRSILTSIGAVGLLTGVAYTASVLRDAVLAAFYGGSTDLDIYYIALAPSQFLGVEIASLAYLSFLPEFSQALGNRNALGGSQLLRERVRFATKGTVSVAIVLTLAGSLLTRVFAPGYSQDATLRVLRLSFAGLTLLIPLIGVMGVLRSFLEAQGRFAPWALLPAFRSGVLSGVVILSTAARSITWLVLGTLLGAGVGLASFWISARKSPLYVAEPPDCRNREGLRPLPASLGPLIASLIAGQATVILDNAFASRTGIGGVQAFALASNLLVIPQALITGAVATVYFPVYAAHHALGESGIALRRLRGSLRLVVWSAVPVVLFFCTDLGTILARLIYHRGAFDDQMVLLVSHTAAGLSLGLAPYACIVLMRQYLLVADGPWLVFHAALVFFCVKWVGNLVLTNPFGVTGIALSSSLAAIATCAYLAVRILRPTHTFARLT